MGIVASGLLPPLRPRPQCEAAMASPVIARGALRLSIRCHATHSRAQRLIPARRTAATYTSPHQAARISEIPTTVDPNSRTYQDNAASMSSLVEKLSHLHAQAAQGGPEKARTKHQEQGTVFLAGPPLVKAATGEEVSAEEL